MFITPRKQRKRLLTRAAAIMALLTAGLTGTAMAQSGTYTTPNGGVWSDSGNWVGNVIADGADNTADFQINTLSNSDTATLDSIRTIGNVSMTDVSGDNNVWELNNGGTAGNILTLDVTSGTPTITSTTRDFRLDLVLAGSDGLLIQGPGTTTLLGVNTYTGTTTVRSGTLGVEANSPSGSPGGLGDDTSALQIGDGGTLSTDNIELHMPEAVTIDRDVVVNNVGNQAIISSQINTGSGTRLLTGSLTLNRDITVAGKNRGIQFDGEVSGSGGIVVDSHLTMTNTNNSYTGNTVVSSGQFYVEGDAPNGSNGTLGNATTPLVLGDANTGGQSIYFGTNTPGIDIARDIRVTASGTGVVRLSKVGTTGAMTYSGDIRISRDIEVSSRTGTDLPTFTGVIYGAGGITKIGDAGVLFKGVNTYTGDYVHADGTLEIEDPVPASGPGPLGAASTPIVTNATGPSAFRMAASVSFDREVQVIGNNNMRFWTSGGGTVGTYNGAISLNTNGEVQISIGPTTQLVFNGQLSGTSPILVTGNTSGAGNRVVLANADNDFTGELRVSYGFLQVNADAPNGAPGALGNSTDPVLVGYAPSGTRSGGLLTGGPIEIGRDVNIIDSASGRRVIGGGTADVSVYSGTIDNANVSSIYPTNFTAAPGGEVRFIGQITGAGDIYIGQNMLSTSGATGVATGGDVVFASAANDFTGPIVVGNGRLIVEANNALGTVAGGTTVESSRVLGFRGGVNYTTAEPVTLDGGSLRNIAGENVFAGDITLNSASSIGANHDLLTLSGIITGSDTLTANGAPGAAVSITSDNSATFSGAVVITSGTLLADNTTGSATGSGGVTVNAGGILGGHGAVGGTVTVNPGGTLAPGNSAGNLTVDNDVAFSSGSTFDLEILAQTSGFEWDVLTVNGTVDLSDAILAVTLTTPVQNWQELFIVVNDDVDAITGEFLGRSQGSLITLSPGNFARISYFGDSTSGAVTGGNDVVLYDFQTAIPEPASIAMLSIIGLLTQFRRNRYSTRG